MAIAKDYVTYLESTDYAEGTSYTWSHTCTGTNLILVVSVALWQDSPGTGSISGMTYNGVVMSSGKAVTYAGMRAEIWYLINPATGAHNIVATVTGDTDDRAFVSSSWTGCKLTGQPDASNSNGAESDTITVSVTTVADNSVVIDAASNYSTATLTNTQNLLRKGTQLDSGYGASYSNAKTPPGAVVMSWTKATVTDWASVAISLAPALGGPKIIPELLALQPLTQLGSGLGFS